MWAEVAGTAFTGWDSGRLRIFKGAGAACGGRSSFAEGVTCPRGAVSRPEGARAAVGGMFSFAEAVVETGLVSGYCFASNFFGQSLFVPMHRLD